MKKLMITVMVAGMAAAAMAGASFSYSGRLTLAGAGGSVEKTPVIEFRLYESASGGDAVWGRDIAVRVDESGYFAAELSDSAGSTPSALASKPTLERTLANSPTLYLGLNVRGSAGEIQPRQKLLSTPRAIYAEDVSRASGKFEVTDTATFNGAVSVNARATFSDTVTFTKAPDFEQGAKFCKSATFEQGATFTKDATFSNGAKIEGTAALNAATVSGAATFGSSMAVSGAATFGDKTTFNGESEFKGKATFTGGISVASGGIYDVMPVGTIVMWYGTRENVPKGWAICDGTTKGVPNLVGRFPMGARANFETGTTYDLCTSGGVAKVQLKVEHLPSHSHSIKLGQRKYNTDMSGNYWGWGVNGPNSFAEKPVWDTGADWTATSNQTGDNEGHENLPPFMALYFIMRTDGKEPELR